VLTGAHRRPLMAWMLLASVLFSLVACGVHHGQMTASQLSGEGGVFHAGSSDHSPSGQASESHDSASAMAVPFACPLCPCFAFSSATDSRALALDYVPEGKVAPIVVRSVAQPPPRTLRPALNPRASPDATDAATLSA